MFTNPPGRDQQVQGPVSASIEVGNANKEASGKPVNLGPGSMGDTKERLLKIGGKGAEE